MYKNLICIFLLLAGCTKQDASAGSSTTSETDTVPPTLYNLAIDFTSYSASTNSAGAVDFQMTHPLVIYKDTLWGHAWPDICYFTKPGYPIYSPINGVVSGVEEQNDDGVHDYEIQLKEKTNSAWSVVLDHLSSPQVTSGQTVTVGQIIAYTSDSDGAATSKLLELDIYGPNNQNPCPMTYLHSSVKSDYETKISNLMQAIETHNSDSSIYNESAMVSTGCYSL